MAKGFAALVVNGLTGPTCLRIWVEFQIHQQYLLDDWCWVGLSPDYTTSGGGGTVTLTQLERNVDSLANDQAIANWMNRFVDGLPREWQVAMHLCYVRNLRGEAVRVMAERVGVQMDAAQAQANLKNVRRRLRRSLQKLCIS